MNRITFHKTFEDANDADVATVMKLSEIERIEHFRKQLQVFKMPDSNEDAFREYHRWLSLLDDKYVKQYFNI